MIEFVDSYQTAYHSDLMAIKFLFYDGLDYERDGISQCKYQTIAVVRINVKASNQKIEVLLDSITEGMFSSSRIDYFCFVNEQNLAMIMGERICLVDWRTKSIQKCLELSGLYSPFLEAGIALRSIYAFYWYDRVVGKVKFCLGVNKAQKEDFWLFVSDLSKMEVDLQFLLSGAFDVEGLETEQRGDEVFGNSEEGKKKRSLGWRNEVKGNWESLPTFDEGSAERI